MGKGGGEVVKFVARIRLCTYKAAYRPGHSQNVGAKAAKLLYVVHQAVAAKQSLAPR
jgi:hypothetical protein